VVEIRFEGTADVPDSPSDAFTIADMARLSEWNPAVRRSELIDGTAMTVGATYRCVVVNGPARLTATPVLTAVEAGCFISYSGKFGFAHSEDSIRFDPAGEGTRLTFRNVSRLPGWTRPLAGLITRVFHRQAQKSIDGAVAYLDRRRSTPTG
jgi:hypothetical protein